MSISSFFDQYFLNQFFISLIAGVVISFLSYKAKFLSFGGSVVTFLLAVSIFGIGGIMWAVPILTFFILSSLLSKMGKNAKKRYFTTFEKTGIRDQYQVLANGGIGGILVLISYFYYDISLYYAYLISLATATADTWATEIGIIYGKNTIKITNFQKVDPGTSGGITIPGTLAAFLGSLVITFVGYLMYPLINIKTFFMICLLGFFASLTDSVFGATIQAQYKCKQCAGFTEKKYHCNIIAEQISGYTFINNDMVNFLSALSGTFIYIIFTLI